MTREMKPKAMLQGWSPAETQEGLELRCKDNNGNEAVYVLDELACDILRIADGTRTAKQIVYELPRREIGAVWRALDELADAGLLAKRLYPPAAGKAQHCRRVFSRREAFGHIAAGLAVGLSVSLSLAGRASGEDPPVNAREVAQEHRRKATEEKHYKGRETIESYCKQYGAEDALEGRPGVPDCHASEDSTRIASQEAYVKKARDRRLRLEQVQKSQ